MGRRRGSGEDGWRVEEWGVQEQWGGWVEH